MDLFIWGGPVSTSNIDKVRWERDTSVLTVNHGPDGGIGSSSFALLAASLKDGQGRILPNLLRQRGLDAASFDQIAIGGFSAFHGLAAPLLQADGDRIDAAVLSDACFSGYDHLTKQGYIDFGVQAALGRKLFVVTASAGGGKSVGYSTGWECADANFYAAQQASGVVEEAYAPPSSVPPPELGRGLRMGNFIYLNYSSQYSHGDHVHKLAVPVLNTYLVPYLAGESDGPIASPRGPGSPVDEAGKLVAAAGLLTLAGGLVWAARSRSWPFS